MPATKLLLLFIHGLGGSAASWGSFEELILADPELSSRVDVRFFAYPTGFIRYWFGPKYLELQSLADGLGSALAVEYDKYEKVMLVCHSMGGLIAKRYIVDQLVRKQQLRIGGVIFFATPHQGAELASVVAALSREHKQAIALQPDAVFLGTVNKHWDDHSCEAHVDTTYVVAGQDSFVSKESAGGPLSSHRETDLNKGHLDIVKPSTNKDYAFLFLRAAARRVLYDRHGDFAAATRAIETGDSHALEQLIASKGRSWIETRYSDQATDLLNRVIEKFNKDSAEVVWSKYLLIISRLFKSRNTSSTAIDDELIATSEQLRLAPLLLAEKMELARKRNDQIETIALYSKVTEQLANRAEPRAAGEAYAVGTSHFLVGNLLRFGGLYSNAKASIETARVFFRPVIMSHQIELAHCQYALEVCKAVMGETNGENAVPTGSGEFRPFAEALLTLVRSHSEWSKGRIAEATEHADAASQAFAVIGYGPYADRARRLSNILHVWRRLDLGAPIDRATSTISEDSDILRALIGMPGSAGTIRDKLSNMRVSHVLGLLQFSSTYNPDWTEEIGGRALPGCAPVIPDQGVGASTTWACSKPENGRRKALKVVAEAEKGANILCMLPDTGERYLSTPLFANVSVDMNEEELEISLSTPGAQLSG